VFKASVLCASILWLINAAYNFAARDYRAFCINVLYVLCLVAICEAYYSKEDRVLQGMIGALMMICVIGNVNVMSEMLETAIPSCTLRKMIAGSVLTFGLFLNHFMIVRKKTKKHVEDQKQPHHNTAAACAAHLSGHRKYRSQRFYRFDD